jgi:GTPase Era involved in 16S rRNA processing
MEEVISAFLHLLNDTEWFIKRSRRYQTEDLERFLHDFRTKRVNPLYHRLKRLESPRYVLSMVGLTNVGKSTLAHALLGHPVAPRRNGPATAIPVEYEYSHEWLLETHATGTQQVRKLPFESSADLSTALKAKVFSESKSISSTDEGIERIIVHGPMDLLKDGIVFADTPGFGAAQSEVDGSSHEQVLVDYLKAHVHEVMFCVSGSNAMVSRSEEQFFRAIQEICSTVIVTKWDSDPNMRAREEEKYREKFSELFSYCGFMFVEAKWAIEGRERESIEALNALIRERATRENRIAAIRDQVVSAWDDLMKLMQEPLRKSGAPAVPWGKASLPMFLNAAKDQNLNFVSPP